MSLIVYDGDRPDRPRSRHPRRGSDGRYRDGRGSGPCAIQSRRRRRHDDAERNVRWRSSPGRWSWSGLPWSPSPSGSQPVGLRASATPSSVKSACWLAISITPTEAAAKMPRRHPRLRPLGRWAAPRPAPVPTHGRQAEAAISRPSSCGPACERRGSRAGRTADHTCGRRRRVCRWPSSGFLLGAGLLRALGHAEAVAAGEVDPMLAVSVVLGPHATDETAERITDDAGIGPEPPVLARGRCRRTSPTTVVS
jgi:hypothetical protein